MQILVEILFDSRFIKCLTVMLLNCHIPLCVIYLHKRCLKYYAISPEHWPRVPGGNG